MKKSKTSEPQGQDRLSELPDSLIFHVLWFVPMSDVIKTSVLSKRWRNLWTSLNFVNIDDNDDDVSVRQRLRKIDYCTNRFRNLVNRALLCWNGERILKFKVETSGYLDKSIHDDIDMWLRFAQKNEVEELYLHFRSAKTDDYWVPQFLFSCSSLKELSLKHCNFNTNMNVECNQLKSLTITDGFEVTNHLVSQILTGSPRLEVLILSFADRGESLSIRSKSLKKLSIYKFLYERDYRYRYSAQSGEIWMDTKLKIRTPNLESLEIKGIPYGGYLLNDVASLTHATLGLGCSGLDFVYEDHMYALTTGDFLGDIYSRILPRIQHVEHVTLLFGCMKVLGAMKKRCMHSSFPNVKSLQIGYRFNDCKQLVVVLESFTQLKTLVLQPSEEDEHHYEQDSLEFDSKSYLKFLEATLPNSFLLQLKTVDVTWDKGDNIFPFIEILLKFTSKLEKMIFRVKEIEPPSPHYSRSYSSAPSPSPNRLVLASQKLLKMQRTFPKCTIDIM